MTEKQLKWYLSELLRWNLKINLTGHKSFETAWEDLIEDSLHILPYLNGDEVLDIGTGAGIPGMVLAIADRDRNFTLLDSRRKRTNFISRIARHLNLGHRVKVVTGRAPEHLEGKTYDCITLRAVSSIENSLALATPLLKNDGIVILPRAVIDLDEATALGCQVIKYHCYNEDRIMVIHKP